MIIRNKGGQPLKKLCILVIMLLIITGCAKPAKPNNPTEVVNRFCSAMMKQNKSQLQELIAGHGEEDIDFLLKFDAQSCEVEEEIIQNEKETQMFVRVRTPGFTTKNGIYRKGPYRLSVVMDNTEDYTIKSVRIYDRDILTEENKQKFSLEEVREKLIKFIPEELNDGLNYQRAGVDDEKTVLYYYASYEDPMNRLDETVRYNFQITFSSNGMNYYHFRQYDELELQPIKPLTVEEGKGLAEQFAKEFINEQRALDFEYTGKKETNEGFYDNYTTYYQGELLEISIDLNRGFVVMMTTNIVTIENTRSISIKEEFLPPTIDEIIITQDNMENKIVITPKPSVMEQIVAMLDRSTDPEQRIHHGAGATVYKIIIEANEREWVIEDEGLSCQLQIDGEYVLETVSLGLPQAVLDLLYEKHRIVYDLIATETGHLYKTELLPLSIETESCVIEGIVMNQQIDFSPELWQLKNFDWKEYGLTIYENDQKVDSLPDTVGIHDVILENEYGTYQLKYIVKE